MNPFRLLWEQTPAERAAQRSVESSWRQTRADSRQAARERWEEYERDNGIQRQPSGEPALAPRAQQQQPPPIPPRPATPRADDQEDLHEQGDHRTRDGQGPNATGQTPDREPAAQDHREDHDNVSDPGQDGQEPNGNGEPPAPPEPPGTPEPPDPADRPQEPQDMPDNNDPRTFRLRAPCPGEFSADTHADMWEHWLEKWRAFLVVSGLKQLSTTTDGAEDVAKAQAKKEQIKSAMYQAFSMHTIGVVASLGLSDEQAEDPEEIIKALTNHLRGAATVWVNRYHTGTRQRREGEPFEDFVAALRSTARKASYQQCCQETTLVMSIMTGVRDTEVTQKLLQLPAEATLADVIKEATTILAAKRDSGTLTKGTRPTTNRIQTVDRPPAPQPNQGRPQWRGRPIVQGGCPKCGNNRHQDPSRCPAIGQKCIRCGNVGHYNRCCPNKGQPRQHQPAAATATAPHPRRDHEAVENATNPYNDAIQPYNPPAILDRHPSTSGIKATPRTYSVVARAAKPTPRPRPQRPYRPLQDLPLTTIHIRGANSAIGFLADSGANFSVIPLRDYRRLGFKDSHIDRQSPITRDPRTADGRTDGIQVVGVVQVAIATDHRAADIDLYVAHGVDQPLLSKQASFQLGIIQPGNPDQ